MVQVVRIIRRDDIHSENMCFLWSKRSYYQKELRCHARDERTNGGGGGGKWKIEQCSVRPETATIHILEKYSLIMC